MASSNIQPHQLLNVRMVQNFHLVWLDGSIDAENRDDCRSSITKLRQVVNTVNTFTDVNECIEFINGIKEEKTFMISSGFFGQIAVPAVHDKPQLNAIYIFCGNTTRHEKWAKQWPKVRGVFTDITPICEALKQTVQDCDHNSTSISFVQKTDGSSNQDLDTLDKSFMYTQILKEILITIDFKESHINDFLSYCRTELAENTFELANVEILSEEYDKHQPIWWYTYESFLYSMLNRALRLMEIDRIIKIGFFLRDLHNDIAELHAEQYGALNNSNSFIVYRGQGLSRTDFDRLENTQGGLLAFNNFLSTSTDDKRSLRFARRTIATSDLIGVLFVMEIDPSLSATPFANVKDVSCYQEEEILFSMHSVFRIGQVKEIEGNNRLYQVNVTLTSDNDPQLHALTKRIHEETSSGSEGWLRLGMLMIKLGQFNQADKLYDILLKQTNNESEKALLYHHLGMVKNDQGKYAEAVQFYEKALEISQKTFPIDHSNLATSYNNIGGVYKNMGEPSKALAYYEKALDIRQKTLPASHPDLATSYNNIGGLCDHIGAHLKALSYYEEALKIFEKTLPVNHPDLATSYNNIGGMYDNMGEYLKGLSYYEKALEIKKQTLPADHPSLATSYNNIGGAYQNMGEYTNALSYYEKALEIRQKALPEDHPAFAQSYNNIGWLYRNKGDYLEALSYYERALDILQRVLPSSHPHLKSVKQSIEFVKKKL